MKDLESIEDLQRVLLAREGKVSDYGEVRYEIWDDLMLFDYKSSAQYAGRWNWFERVSRGLILNTVTGEVVARPFDKFFNWGENGREPTTPIIEICEKLDGSMGTLYRHKGEYRIATRGAFHSEQAVWATEYLNQNYGLRGLGDWLTLIFEIIYPENRVIVDYAGREDLVLIGVRDRFTGEDWFYPQIAELAQRYGFSLPQTYTFASTEELIAAAHDLPLNNEGWVIRCADGLRLKVKGDAYRLVHRIKTQATFNQVLDAMSEGRLMAIIDGIPDEFLDSIRAWQAEIEGVIAETQARIDALVSACPREDRKAAALWIRENCPRDSAYVFAMMDGRDIIPLIYRNAFKGRRVDEG